MQREDYNAIGSLYTENIDAQLAAINDEINRRRESFQLWLRAAGLQSVIDSNDEPFEISPQQYAEDLYDAFEAGWLVANGRNPRDLG